MKIFGFTKRQIRKGIEQGTFVDGDKFVVTSNRTGSPVRHFLIIRGGKLAPRKKNAHGAGLRLIPSGGY